MITTIGESTRQLIAERIRTGDVFDGDLGGGAAIGSTKLSHDKQKDRNR